jgi:rifampicin phosphotransferase
MSTVLQLRELGCHDIARAGGKGANLGELIKAGFDVPVTGTPAGGGRVTGAVRIVREPSEFGTLKQGEILVCPATNPSWTPLFQRAGAVVVDSGGLASHAAIVAREYGIPAIMGTGRGTRVLSNGQLVTVDGGSGRVVAYQPEGRP